MVTSAIAQDQNQQNQSDVTQPSSPQSTDQARPRRLSSSTIQNAQKVLKEQGYYKGRVDGIMGPQTRSALRRYQQDKGLHADGRLTRETAEPLDIVSTDTNTPGEYFEEAGQAVTQEYGKAGKAMGHGAKQMGREVKKGEVVQGAKELGKGVGRFGKHVGKGTAKGAKKAAQGVKDVFNGDENKPKKNKP